MRQWNHSICERCWGKKCADEGEPGRVPRRIVGEYLHKEKCCFCGVVNKSGIYVRGKPEETPCEGKHSELPPDEPALEVMPKLGGDIAKFGKELAQALSKVTLQFRDEVLDESKDHNIANNAAIYGASMNLAAAMTLVIRDSKNQSHVAEDVFNKIEYELNDAICKIMTRYIDPRGAVVSLEIEKPDNPKSGPA